ncbi:MAG: hypothetical protein ACK4TA_16525 [Saprospiraceae bacterium]
MKFIQNIISIALFMMLFPLLGMAQKDLPSGQVEVIRNFDARLLETDPLRVRPELPALDTAIRRMRYDTLSRTFEVTYQPPRIRPLAMQGEDIAKGYNGYARLGGGFPGSVLGEGGYTVNVEDQYNFGINVFHHSANNNKNVENQRFGYTNLGARGTYYLEQGFGVSANLGYTIDNVHFFGYNALNEERDPDITFASEDVKQSFTTFDVGARLFNSKRTEADFNYHAGFNAYFMQDNYAARENGFKLDIGATKWFNEKHPFRINLITDFTGYRDTASQSLNNFYLQPNFTFHGERFKAKIGANITSHEDEFSFFPDVELSANIINTLLGAYVGAEGSLQKNTFRSLTDYNPFLSSRIMLENTRYTHYYGGIRGNFSGVEYRAQLGFKQADDLALFLVNADTLVPRFDVLYDTVNIFNIQGTLSFPLTKELTVLGTINYNLYDTQNEEKAWHLPALTINSGLRYSALEGKLLVKADLFLENGVPFRNDKGEAENLNALFDISLGADYLFTENIGAFVQINNLANNRRQRWQYYPMFGLNALIGVTARF